MQLRATWIVLCFGCALYYTVLLEKKETNKKSGEGDLNSRPKDYCVDTLYSPLLYR